MACDFTSPASVAENNSTAFEKIFNRVSNLGHNNVETIMAIRDHLNDNHNTVTANAFFHWVEHISNIDEKEVQAAFFRYLSGEKSTEIKQKNISKFLNAADPNDQDKFLEEYLVLETEPTINDEGGTLETDKNNTDTDVRYNGLDFLNSIFFHGLKQQITPEEYAKFADKVRNMTYKKAMTEASIDFKVPLLSLTKSQIDGKDPNGNRLYKYEERKEWYKLTRSMRKWHTSNAETNKRKRSEVLHLALVDFKIDADGKIYKDHPDGTKGIKGDGAFSLMLAYINNFLTKRPHPKTEAASFIQNSKKPYGKTDSKQSLDANTGYLKFDDIVRARENGDTKEVFYVNDNNAMSKSFLENELEAESVSKFKMTVVATVAGDSAKVFMAKILPEHLDSLLPKDIIESFYKKGKIEAWFNELKGTSPTLSKIDSKKVADYIAENNFDLFKAIETLKKNPNLALQARVLTSFANFVAENSYEGFWKNEKNLGNMNETHEKGFLSTLKQYKSKNIPSYLQLASQISRYRWWQAVTVDNYLMELSDSPMDLFDRLKIGAGKGLVPIGAIPTKTILIDPKKTKWYRRLEKKDGSFDRRVPLKHMRPIPDLGGIEGKPKTYTYIGDGTLFRDTYTFKNWGNIFGSNKAAKDEKHQAEAKTVRRNQDENGFSLDKSQSTVVPPGLEIRDMNEQLILRSYYDKALDEVIMVDANGDTVNEFLTPDERKMSTGEYAEFNKITTVEEGSERAMILQGQYSHSDVAFPGQMFDITEDPRKEHTEANNIFEKHAMNVIKTYMNEVMNMMIDPKSLKKAIARMVKYNNEQLETELRKLYKLDPNAVHHGSILSMALPMINNNIIKNGILKTRTRGKKDVGGSYTTLKVDIFEDIVNKNNTIISPNNQTIWKIVAERYFKSKVDSKRAREKFNKMDKDLQLEKINEFLENNVIDVLVSRHPVDSATGVSMKRLQEFSGWWDSDSTYLHPDYVFGSLRADHDGDHVNVEILPDDIAQDLKVSLKKFDNIVVDLKWFEDSFADMNITNPDDFFKVSSALLNTAATAPGMAANMRSIRSTLIKKDIKIKLKDGRVLKPIRADENVDMDYIFLTDKKRKELKSKKGKVKDVEVVDTANVKRPNLERKKPKTYITSASTPSGNWRLVLIKDGEKIQESPYSAANETEVIRKEDVWRKKLGLTRKQSPYFPRESDAVSKKKDIAKEHKDKAYIRTTSEYEMAIILNAAVDNPKKLKLYQMGYDGSKASRQFFISKYWKIVDSNGVERRLDPKNSEDSNILKMLQPLSTHFNMSPKKNGKMQEKNRREANLKEMWEMMAEQNRLNNLTNEQYTKELVEILDSDLIDILKMTNNTTLNERIFSKPFEILMDKMPEEPYPFASLDPSFKRENMDRLFNIQVKTIEDMYNIFEQDPISHLDLTDSQIDAAETWLGGNYLPFYEAFNKSKSSKKDIDYNPTARKIDHDETMVLWHRQAKKEINDLVEKHGEGVRKWITLAFLEGRDRINVIHVPSVDILDKDLMKLHRQKWTANAFSRDNDGALIIPFDKKIRDRKKVDRLFRKDC